MSNEIKTEINEILKEGRSRNALNKEKIKNWKASLDFFNRRATIPIDSMEVMEAVTKTDVMPRLVWDSTFRIIDVNDNFLKALGYEREDLIGEYIIKDGKSKFIATKFIIDSIEVVTNNMKNGAIEMLEGIENQWYKKDGSVKNVNWFKGFNHTGLGIGSTQCEFICSKNGNGS